MADLTKDDVLKLAQLSRIKLSEEEVSEFISEINDILHYVEQLQNADIEAHEPTSQVTGLTNVTRKDEVAEMSYSLEDLMKNVPQTQAGHIKTRRMIG